MNTTINNWKVYNPEWENLEKCAYVPPFCWKGENISGQYLTGDSTKRIFICYPSIVKEFYFLVMVDTPMSDKIFATYDKEEMKKFIRKLKWHEANKQRYLVVYNPVTKNNIAIDEFMKE